MKVYEVVVDVDYEGRKHEGLYKSYQGACDRMQELANRYPEEEYVLMDNDVMSNNLDSHIKIILRDVKD